MPGLPPDTLASDEAPSTANTVSSVRNRMIRSRRICLSGPDAVRKVFETDHQPRRTSMDRRDYEAEKARLQV